MQDKFIKKSFGCLQPLINKNSTRLSTKFKNKIYKYILEFDNLNENFEEEATNQDLENFIYSFFKKKKTNSVKEQMIQDILIESEIPVSNFDKEKMELIETKIDNDIDEDDSDSDFFTNVTNDSKNNEDFTKIGIEKDPNYLLQKCITINGIVSMVVDYQGGYLVTFDQNFLYIYQYNVFQPKIQISKYATNLYNQNEIFNTLFNIKMNEILLLFIFIIVY